MSITGLLTQISPELLKKVKDRPSVLDVFWRVLILDDETPKIDNLYGLASKYLELLQEILVKPEKVVVRWTLYDLETIALWKSYHAQDYILFRQRKSIKSF